MTKADGIELAFNALRYEEMNFKSSDTKKRWDINEDGKKNYNQMDERSNE